MKNKNPFRAMLALALVATGHAQPLDKSKLDHFLDRLSEKNEAMGHLSIVQARWRTS